jgi:hypothetical protein
VIHAGSLVDDRLILVSSFENQDIDEKTRKKTNRFVFNSPMNNKI